MPAHRSVASRRASFAALAILTSTSLLGCAGEPGAAAIVGTDRFTVAELQSSAEDFTREVLGAETVTGGAALQRVIVQNHVYHQLHLELAERLGIEVSGAAVDDLLAAVRDQSGGSLDGIKQESGLTDETLRQAAYDILVRERAAAELGSEQVVVQELTALDAELDTWVNPRYGTWEGTALQPGSGSISTPAGSDPLG